MNDKSKVERADAQFAKLQKAQDGKKAATEYEAERSAVLAKTERLKALRLARDAAGGSAPQSASPQPSASAKGPVRRKKKNAKSLASFLADRDGSGHRS